MLPLIVSGAGMPRYFFDMFNGSRSVDDEGVVLPDNAEARRQGISAAGAIFGEEGDHLRDGEALTMIIRNEASSVVCTIRLTISW